MRSKDTTVVDNGRVERRRGLTGAELFAAFVTGEIFTYQQPVISLGDGTVVQYEARRRPGDSRAERDAEMMTCATLLDASVLASALDFILCVRSLDHGSTASVSVNVLAGELSEPSFAPTLLAHLRVAEADPSLLRIELVDRFDAPQRIAIQHTTNLLREHGVRVALDDFGHGPTDLCTLGDLDFDAIKLAPELIATDLDSHGDRLLHSIIELAGQLGIDTIATGVELPEQHERLVRAGCGHGQGELYGRPQPHRLGSDVVTTTAVWPGLVRANERVAAISRIAQRGAVDDGALRAVLHELNQVCGTELALFATNEPAPNRVVFDALTGDASRLAAALADHAPSICHPEGVDGAPCLEPSEAEPSVRAVGARVVGDNGVVLGAVVVAAQNDPTIDERLVEIIGRAGNRIVELIDEMVIGSTTDSRLCVAVGGG